MQAAISQSDTLTPQENEELCAIENALQKSLGSHYGV
jgi:hypothetical protein